MNGTMGVRKGETRVSARPTPPPPPPPEKSKKIYIYMWELGTFLLHVGAFVANFSPCGWAFLGLPPPLMELSEGAHERSFYINEHSFNGLLTSKVY